MTTETAGVTGIGGTFIGGAAANTNNQGGVTTVTANPDSLESKVFLPVITYYAT